MTERLTLKAEAETWYPNSINTLELHLATLLKSNEYFSSDQIYPMRKNLAYSLQYVQFLNQVIKDISLSTVLWTQNVKSFVVHGAAAIEAIFNYLVVSNGFGNTTHWKKVNNHFSPEYTLATTKYKNEVDVLEKLDAPQPIQMTFDQLAKKVESKKLLGSSFNEYSKIKPIRQLRNKIHIHDAQHISDTDWNNFNKREYLLISNVLHKVITSEVFSGSSHMDKFEYLSAANNQIQQIAATTAD